MTFTDAHQSLPRLSPRPSGGFVPCVYNDGGGRSHPAVGHGFEEWGPRAV